MTNLAIIGTVYARHNWGRWVADCPTCPSALTVPPGTTGARCHDCGEVIGPILWPADPDGIEVILAMRPDPNTRNWEPGETLDDLLADNAIHGLIPARWHELTAAAGGQLAVMDTVDGVLVGGLLADALPAGRPRPAIGA